MSLISIRNDKNKMKKLTEAAFKAIDSDNSGTLDKSEIIAIMTKISNEMGIENPSKEEIEEVIEELDVDKNGVLSLDEFAVTF